MFNIAHGRPWIPVLALLIWPFAFSLTAYGATSDEKSKAACVPDMLYRSLVKTNKFTVDRGLNEYRADLHPAFLYDLVKLNEHDILLDGGAGKAVALTDYLYHPSVQTWRDRNGKHLGKKLELPLPPEEHRADVIAVAFKRPELKYPEEKELKLKTDQDPKFKYIEGDIYELLKTHPELQGRVSMIIDNFGILKYAALDRVLEIYLTLLRENGKIYFRTPDARIMRKAGTSTYDEYIANRISISEYFGAIQGAVYRHIPSINHPTDPITADSQGAHVLEKVSSKISVPKLTLEKATSLDEMDESGPDTKYVWLGKGAGKLE